MWFTKKTMTPYQGFPLQWLMQIPSSEISLEIMIVPNIFTESNSRIQILGGERLWGCHMIYHRIVKPGYPGFDRNSMSKIAGQVW